MKCRVRGCEQTEKADRMSVRATQMKSRILSSKKGKAREVLK